MTERDKPQFLQAFNRLATALREKEQDAIALRVYFDALADLEIEFVTAAADRFATSAQWFPKSSEWHAAAQRIEDDRTDAQRALLRKLPEPLCLACGDTGWERFTNGVKRCGCVEQRRLEVLGRRPMPALPEANVEAVDPDQFDKVRAMVRPLVETKTL